MYSDLKKKTLLWIEVRFCKVSDEKTLTTSKINNVFKKNYINATTKLIED